MVVVDDEPMVGALVSQALGTSEFKTVVVTDMESAEVELARVGFDVLVCDINLDGESGVALIDHARVRQGQTAVVVMSGQAERVPLHELEVLVTERRDRTIGRFAL